MSKVNPSAVAHYNYSQGICEAEPVAAPVSPKVVMMAAAAASLRSAPALASAPSLLLRNPGASLGAGQIRVDALNQKVVSQLENPVNIAFAFAAPALAGKAREWSTVAEVSLASMPGRAAVVRGGAALMSLSAAACSGAPEGGDYVTADAGSLPSDEDVTCDNLYDTINRASSDPALSTLVQNISYPALDVTHDGNNGIPVIADSKGELISSITPNNPVAWVKKGDKLFVITANKNGDAYAPATLFVFKLNADNTLASSEPLPTSQFNQKAILLAGSFAPTNMSAVELEGVEWLGITLGAAGENKTLLVDPAGPFNPAYDPEVQPDYCAIKDYADAGADAGSVDGGK